ncbi:hypothetical protein NON20_01930 [Synechocystis sp. B12]|nr:hypothetical protein NON20_01930 [Synechocystis sp. B12]
MSASRSAVQQAKDNYQAAVQRVSASRPPSMPKKGRSSKLKANWEPHPRN